MSQPAPCIQVSLSETEYRPYATAARLLIRVMGRKAPDALTLIRHTLRGRDATGIADDYLDSISWRTTPRDAALLRRPARQSVPVKPTVATQRRAALLRPRASMDPTRN